MSFLIQQTLIYAVPLMIVALAGVFAERSGIINLALEGIMIFGAFIGVLFVRQMQGLEVFNAAKAAGDWGTLQGLVLLAMLVSAAMGALFSLLLSFASINLRADQTIGGTALNLLATALAMVIAKGVNHSASAKLDYSNRVFVYDFGPLTVNVFLFIGLVALILSYIVLYKTRLGLRLRACGEHPQAADSVGINVYKMRWAGVLISGLLGGLGGIVYITAGVSEWKFENGVAGFGFLSLAVMIFGQWKPIRIALAALLFGMFRALSNVYTGFDFLTALNMPSTVYNMLPYIISLIVLAFTSKKSRAPKAEGIPYDKGSR